MNNATFFRNPLQGYLYYNINGKDYKANVEQGNLIKINDKNFDGTIVSRVPEFTFYEIQVADGTRTFLFFSAATSSSSVGSSGVPRRGVNVLDNGSILGLAQNINFTGAGVSTTFNNGQATVTISGGIAGSGTLNYIPKFTPDGSTLGNSLLFDDGVSVLFGGTAAIPSAGIALTSTTQGFLVPRMTTVQRNAIAAPATGLLIYNTSTSLFSYFDGVTWQNIDSQAGGDVSGSGTTNFVTKWTDGTNSVIGDSQLFDDGTSVGVGIAVPLSKLHVAGTIRTGVASTTNGSLIFQNSTNANTLTINSGVTAASYSLTLPSAQGAASTFLQNNGAGVLSWVSASTMAWMLDGNTVGSEKWIGTIDNFNFPIRTNNTVRGLVDNGGLWAIGSSSTTAGTRLAITGTGATSATYAIRSYNSTPTEIFSVRNDGYIYAGVGTCLTIGMGSGYDATENGNTIVGVNSGGTGGSRNTLFGHNVGGAITSGARNILMGQNAGGSMTSDFGHVAIGWSALNAQIGLNNTAIGKMNVALGYSAASGLTIGESTTAIGSNTLASIITGTENCALGAGSGYTTTGSGGVFLGTYAGHFETLGNKLFIDNAKRSNEADGRVKALVYGGFAATTAAQWFTLNANVGILTSTFGTSADGVLGIANGVVPSTSPADMIQIFSVDISAGNASLGLRTETAVSVIGVEVPTNYLNIKINGTTYKMLLST